MRWAPKGMRGKAGKARTSHGVDAARPRGAGPGATSAWPTTQVRRVAWGRTLFAPSQFGARGAGMLEQGKENLEPTFALKLSDFTLQSWEMQ